jgi:coniferyl-aldehyde dehydrogenase
MCRQTGEPVAAGIQPTVHHMDDPRQSGDALPGGMRLKAAFRVPYTSGMSLTSTLERQRGAFLRDDAPSLEHRRKALRRLKELLIGRRDDIVKVVDADFGHRSRQETLLFEVASITVAIDYLHDNLARWMRPERRRVSLIFMPGSNRVLYQPLGVVGVVSPWNYPFALALTPVATAIAAGNRVMMKPSELAPESASFMKAMLGEAFSEEELAVVTGDTSVGIEFSKLPFDRILFTGSTGVGRSIMRAAADNLTPVTLELGGKSPVIVEEGSPLDVAARRTAYGKLANAGQTCVAPDFALVAESEVDAFVEAFRRAVDRLYPRIETNTDYTAIINDRHLGRLRGLLDDARAKGATVVELGAGGTGALVHPRIMLPAIVRDTTDDMSVVREEIFGPILPVVPYRTIDDAIAYVNARPRPLALYFFGSGGPAQQKVLERTTSGGVAVNETMMHYAQDDLPFGGVGPSGMGAYHGPEGFKSMSHAKAVFRQARLNTTDAVRPPFGRMFQGVIRYLLR